MTGYQFGNLFGSFIGPFLALASVLYLVKRGRLSFYEAVQNRWVVGFAVLTVVANMAAGVAPRPRVFTDDGQRAAFNSGCIESALSRMERAAAGTACACVINEIENTITRADFVVMNSAMAKTGVPAPEIEAIAGKCEPEGK
jgi:hypothetical protein